MDGLLTDNTQSIQCPYTAPLSNEVPRITKVRKGREKDAKEQIGEDCCKHTGTTSMSASVLTKINSVSDAGVGVDSVPIQSRCSVKSIHDIISRFGDRKKKLVESIGFGGLLKFPAIKTTNRQFSAWLMGMVDVKNSSLTLPDGTNLKIYSKDVGIVFGIPTAGTKVNEAGHLNKKAKEKMKLQCWPLSGKEQNSIKAVQELVDTKFQDEMTPDQEDAFKVAFVVYVMSTLFVPGAKHDYVRVDYWGALCNPSSIETYDWADYVLKRLLASAAKFKGDNESGSRNPIITGCDIFLQIFYLDNMDIKKWSLDHTVKPRISCFTYEKIRSMIAADTYERSDPKSVCVFGRNKVRPRNKSCYSWAEATMPQHTDLNRQVQISLWHAAIRMARILRIPLEAAGPLFIAAVDFSRDSGTDKPLFAVDCLNVLLKIMEPFVNGFKYNFDMNPASNGLQHDEGGLHMTEQLKGYWSVTEDTIKNNQCICKKRSSLIESSSAVTGTLNDRAIGSSDGQFGVEKIDSKRSRLETQKLTEELEDVAGRMDVGGVDYSVIKSMSRFYMLLQYIREQNRIDLNTTTTEYMDCQGVTNYGEVEVVAGARTPWQLGGVWDYNSLTTHSVCCSVEGGGHSIDDSMYTRDRIVHYIPKYIEVLPHSAHDQRVGRSEVEMDMFDAILRCLKQNDDKLYVSEGRLRWRHFFESDLLAAILAGWFDIENPSLRNQFMGSHLAYDIYNCSMLFFPVILHKRWLCFSWCLRMNEIIVFDPACMNIPGFPMRSVYKNVADLLKKTLSTVVPVLFPGWHHEWISASVKPYHWRGAGMRCWNRTGVMCAYFLRCFDGEQLVPELGIDQIEKIAEVLFTEVKEQLSQADELMEQGDH